MKRFILIISLFLLAIAVNAQSGLDTGYDVAVDYNHSVYFYTGTASDTTGVGDSTWAKTVLFNTMDEIECNIYVDVDSVGGTSSVANAHYFIIREKEFPDEAYTNVDTVTYSGTADTTFTISITSASDSRYIQLLEKGKTDELSTEIQKVYFHKIISR